MGPARMRESLTTTPGIREQPRPEGDVCVREDAISGRSQRAFLIAALAFLKVPARIL